MEEILGTWERLAGRRFPASVRDELAEIEDGTVTLAICSDCDFGRFEPVYCGSDDFYRTISADSYYVQEKWEFEQAIDDIRREAPFPKRLLDFGGGSGAFLKLLGRSEPSIRPFLYEKTPAGSAKEDSSWTVLSGDFTESSLVGAPFDAIVSFQVLEHVPDPFALLRAWNAHLRPGGMLIVTTPNAAGPISHFPNAVTEVPPHHVTKWSERTYRAVLPRFGFSIERVRFEPLPDYLWSDYLPVQWNEGIWPASLFGSPAEAIEQLRSAGTRFLHGVPGHTVYIRARRTGAVPT